MKLSISSTSHEKLAHDNLNEWKAMTPEERLDLVETLRLEAGRFLYEYPAPFQRVIEVIRRK